MASVPNTSSISGIAALISVQKSSAPSQGGERRILPDTEVEEVSPRSGNERDTGSYEDNRQPETSFSKLIQSDKPGPAALQRANSNSSATPKDAGNDSPAEPVQDKPETSAMDSVLLVMIQLQALPVEQPVATALPEATSNLPVETGSTLSSSASEQLRQIMDQLMAMLNRMSGKEPAGQDEVAQPSGDIAAPIPYNAAGAQATDEATSFEDILTLAQQAVKQLAGLMPLPADSNVQPVAPSTETSAPVAPATDALPANIEDILNKIAAALEQKLPGREAPKQQVSASNSAPALPVAEARTENTDNANAVKPLPENTSTPVQPDKTSFRQTLERLSDALTSSDLGKEDTAGNTAPSPATVTPTTSAAPQQQDSPFVKVMQQATPTPHTHHVPVQDQVLVNIKNAVSDGLSQIKIQLQPEELGRVEVHITTASDGKTGISITADNRQTLAMLQNEARALQDALRDIGLKTDAGSLNFNLRDSQQDARNFSRQQQGGYTQVNGIEETEEPAFSTAGALYRLSLQQGLDIRV